MNLQPRQSFATHRSLGCALALSVLLHLLVFWPLPSVAPQSSQRVLRLALKPVGRSAVPVQDSATGAAERVAAELRSAPVSIPRTPVAAARTPPPVAEPAALPPPGEDALRALRYALARVVVADGWATHGRAVSMSVQLHVLARRVVGVDVARSSGRDEVDAAVLAAFKAAAGRAVIPTSLPAHGFTVELELEAGDAARSDDAEPPPPG
jgi:outer membrane biosynthesis protein TonB